MIVVIPAYEPDDKLLDVLTAFQARPDFTQIVVDDGSSAACQPIFDAVEGRERVVLLRHPSNRGKGAALKTAFTYIRDHFPETEGIVTVDADGQHLFSDTLAICDVWQKHPDALVTGSRRFTGNVPFKSRWGNGITRGVFHVCTGVKVYDTQTGLRAFGAVRIDEMLGLRGDRYEFEINQLLYCTRNKIDILEVPIETVYLDDNKSSHFHAVKDSWRIYKQLFRYVGTTIVKFLTTSFSSFLIDTLVFCLLFYGVIALLGGWDVAVQYLSFRNGAAHNETLAQLVGQSVLFVSVIRMSAQVIARILSSTCNYLLNKRYVFHAKPTNGFLKYAVLTVVILLLSLGLVQLFTMIGVPEWLSSIFAQMICYPLSFGFQRIFVFAEKRAQLP